MQLIARRVSVSTAASAGNKLCSAPQVVSTVLRVQPRRVTVHAGTDLAQKRCEPCEASQDAMDRMGLSMIMDQETAEKYRAQVDSRWQLVRDSENRLRIKRRMRSKNFVKGLALLNRVGEVAEQEGHHPDLHLEGWNNITIELWTHEREGLSENDFIVAAKLDELLAVPDVQQLLSKKQPEL